MRSYFTDRNIRRMFVLAIFVGLIYVFRHLFLLLVLFVVFHRVFTTLAEWIQRFTKLQFKWCVLIAVGLCAGILTLSVYEGVEAVIARVPKIRHSVDSILVAIRQSKPYLHYRASGGTLSAEDLARHGQAHVGTAMQVAESITRNVLYVFIALVFSVVFLLERTELEHWRESMSMDSVPRILLRYVGHATDAIAITLKLQLIVALVNAAVTLPILLILRLPGIPALIAMLLITGLIPVVGGPIAGGVLITLSYLTRGPLGLGIFLASTFILHKIESYYLNPRLTAKHVKLPGFVIITSLVLFEHVFGLVGVFLSFPCLYVAAKIRDGWIDPAHEEQDEAEALRALRGVVPKLRGFKLKPVALSEEHPDVVSAPLVETTRTPKSRSESSDL